MEIVDTGYPMVLRPSKERIVASLKKMGHKFEPNEGIVDGGVYPWLSKQALESDNKTKRKLVVEEIRHKNEEDLKKLLKRHRTDYESTADKLDRFRKSMVNPHQHRIYLRKPHLPPSLMSL
jgi:hypothetical protein